MFDPKQFGEMLNNMQDTFKNMENQNKQTTLTAKSGGGLISVSCNGNGELIDISIDDSLLEDKESLQILLMSAINDLYKSLEQNRQSTALSMLGNLNLFDGSNNA